MAEDRKGFWHTLPGILTGIAGIITAIGGLLVVLQQIGIFDIAESTSPVDAPATVVATVVTAQDSSIVSRTSRPIAGERYGCDHPIIECGTVRVAIPKSAKVISKERKAKNQNSSSWAGENPNGSIGWADWVGGYQTAEEGDSILISTTLKNWSDAYNREVLLIVKYEMPQQ